MSIWLVSACKFGAFLDDDRFVCGVKSAELCNRMLNAAHTKDLTLAGASEMGLGHKVTKQNAFEEAKKQLFSNRVLVHYKPGLPLILACDASHHIVGVGAVISHWMSDDSIFSQPFVSILEEKVMGFSLSDRRIRLSFWCDEIS